MIDFKKLKLNDVVEVKTKNTTYTVQKIAAVEHEGELHRYGLDVLISGNLKYCPHPVEGRIMDNAIVEGQPFWFLTNEHPEWIRTTGVISAVVK